ncbi:MAG TPA: TIGR03013 family XrtA/PEP-CTERM system glycosyltransferase [Candidatus Saccharimonadales bacterium]|nr:TIGR03013 family XrtA/PEP-CTERM system glycosyltransferase [Candidatus Saccharimonadales bacterium]
MAEENTIGWSAAVASTGGLRFKLLNRNYGASLVRIGAHHVPRRSLILAVSEFFLIMFSLVAATGLRFLTVSAAQDYLSQPRNWVRFLIVTAICQLALYYNDLYDQRASRARSAQLARAVRATGVTLLTLALLYYVFPLLRMERGIAVLAAMISLVTMVAWRLTLENTKTFNRPLERILVLGTGQQGIGLASEILRRPELQYKVVGFLDEQGSHQGGHGQTFISPGILGSMAQVEEIVERECVDRVVLSLSERRGVMPMRKLAALKLQGLPVEDAHSVYERLTGRIMLAQLRPSWLILSEGFHKSRLSLTVKRVTDILGSLVLILLTLPLMAITALAILIDSGSPVLFRQERIGRGGQPFRIFKFRSMRQGSEKGTPRWTADADPRITRVGQFIRRFRLDELPQLFNILRGEMSLIGPRPEVPYFCELLEREIPFFNQRHSVRPGLTGWAQVKYRYGATLEESKVKFEFDLFYIKHLSFLLDLAILVETAKVVFLGRGAK